MNQRQFQWRLILGLIALLFFLYIAQDFIGCYNMLSGSSTWCESLVAKLGF